MLFPALGLTTAMWLLMGPLMGVETGGRAVLTVTVGVLVLVFGILGVRYRAAAWVVAALGGLLGFVNLLTSAPIESCASLATCAVALLAAGAAPQPVVLASTPAAAAPVEAAAVANAERDDLIAA